MALFSSSKEVAVPRFRSQKNQLRALLETPQWRDNLESIAADGISSVGPLMSFLLYEPVLRLRAAIALGLTTSKIHAEKPEMARDILRRLNWRLSEESGNIGWGVPEAVGEILAQCPPLAKDFHRIFFSTILDLGFDDNYVDNDVLRRSCYFAIGRFIKACPQYGEEIRPLLRKGLQDSDAACCGFAAWALGMLPPDLNDSVTLRQLAQKGEEASCLLTDGDQVVVCTPSELAEDTLHGTPRIGR